MTTAAAPVATAAEVPAGAAALHMLRAWVDGVLDRFLTEQSRTLAAIGPECGPLAEAIRALVSGGKRLRPAFCYGGWRAAGGAEAATDADPIVAVAAALELFQAAALIHDDVMDGSDTRRGQPSLHRRFERLHIDGGWTGDPGRFGQAAAVLAGDLCLAWSDETFTASGFDAAALARARPVFDRMRTELMAGQFLDVLEQCEGSSRAVPALERARRVIRHKSARYTVESPLLIGAALAGASGEVAAALSAFGLPLGEAFQLRDDVLGVFGDPADTGKPAGDDLREGKRTALVALAAERAGPADRALLERDLGDPDLGPAAVAAIRDLIETTGALASVEELITSLLGEARTALDAAPISDGPRLVLHDLATAATLRDR